MLPDPLHPAVVHFPLVLAFLVPVAALAVLLLMRRGAPVRGWAVVALMSAALALSAWVSVETGEAQEDRVEAVVPESAIHTHEEAAEAVLIGSGMLFLLALAGLAPGRTGSLARVAATVGSVVVVLLAVRVGASGGDLVYRHGAAAAYSAGESGEERFAPPPAGEREDRDDDDEHRRGG